MDSFKSWLEEVVLKKMGPSFVKGVIAYVLGYIATHSEMLSKMGIVYLADVQDIVIHLKVFSVWAGAAVVGLGMAAMTLIQHHATAAVTGKPQDGTHERATDLPVVTK